MSVVQKLPTILHHVSFMIDRQSDQVLLEQLGIGFAQYKILMTLQVGANISQRMIAETLGQTEAGISRQVKLLQSKDLIVSVMHPTSRREHVIRPTSRGIRIREKAAEILQSYHKPAFASLSEKQLDNLFAMLQIVHDASCDTKWPRLCNHYWE